MPIEIKVLFWNVEDFGDGKSGRRGNYVPLCNFIAQVVRNVDADILCLMELRASAIIGRLNQLHLSLLNAYNAGGPTCDWYCDWVPGSLIDAPWPAPYSPTNVGFAAGQGRNEGYAVFWKQNIDKFVMQRADPIISANATPPNRAVGGLIPNTHSGGVRGRTAAGWVNVLPHDVLVPMGANQYTLPAGSTVAAPGVQRGAGIFLGPGLLAGNQNLNAGDVISAGTQIAPAGITLNSPILGVNPIVVPGNYTLATNLSLTAANVTLIREHVLSLILSCKQRLPGGGVANYVPGGANIWRLGRFPATNGANFEFGARRPAFCTIKTSNTAAPAAQRLIPITFYHAPAAAPGPDEAMMNCSTAQVMYEAMDQGAPPYIQNTRAIVGGDFNKRLDPNSLPFQMFTNTFANNGANFQNAGAPNIRVNQPPPGAVPNFPPAAIPLTAADNPRNKTSIQLFHPIVAPPGGARLPVLSAQFNHYRRSAIDNVLYRGFTALQAPRFQFVETPLAGGAQQVWGDDVYDLVRAVSGQIPAYAGGPPGGAPPNNFFIPPAIVNAFNALPIFALLAAGPPAGLAHVLSAARLLADINIGIFLTAFGGDPAAPAVAYANPPAPPAVITRQRRAAEFIRLFVSDHLPVIFKMRI